MSFNAAAMVIVGVDIRSRQTVPTQDNSTKVYHIVGVDSGYNCSRIINATDDIVLKLATRGIKPINFDIDKNTFKVVESCGAFSRLKTVAGVSPRIIISEIVTSTGRSVSYVVMDTLGRIANVRRDDLIKLCHLAKARNVPFLQNGIFRVVDGSEQIVGYPSHPFIRVVLKTAKKVSAPKKVEMRGKQQELVKEQYTKEQLHELKLAKEKGVNIHLISDNKLSPQQMRVLWVSKSNGMASEYFANKDFSVEAMKFFADRLINKKVFEDCKSIMKPCYNVGQLTELYLGIYSGIDYTSYADPSISSDNMYFKRVSLESEKYKKVDLLVKSTGTKTDLDEITSSAESFLKKWGK